MTGKKTSPTSEAMMLETSCCFCQRQIPSVLPLFLMIVTYASTQRPCYRNVKRKEDNSGDLPGPSLLPTDQFN